MTEQQPAAAAVVWIDGDCRLCLRSRAWIERRDPIGRFCFADFRRPGGEELPLPVPDHEAGVVVRTLGGGVHRGFSAWRWILRQLPGWRVLATVCAYPPLSWLGDPVYRLVTWLR